MRLTDVDTGTAELRGRLNQRDLLAIRRRATLTRRPSFSDCGHGAESVGRTEPATPPLPPPMKMMSYFSCLGCGMGGILTMALDEKARATWADASVSGSAVGGGLSTAYLGESESCWRKRCAVAQHGGREDGDGES